VLLTGSAEANPETRACGLPGMKRHYYNKASALSTGN